MRPAPIPADEIWDGGQRVVVGPPGNDLDSDVAAVEVIVDQSAIGPRMSARCVLEGDDLEYLTAGGTVWVSFYGGQLLPFSVDVQPPGKATPHVLMTCDFDGPQAPGFRATLGGVPPGMSAPDFAEGCAQALMQMADEWRAARAEG